MPHAHPHPAPTATRALLWGVALNLAFVGVEAAGGLRAHSAALLADAGHNFSDVLTLALAAGAAWLARRPAGGRYTYGYQGATIQAALLNAALLYGALGLILWETVGRLRHPAPVNEPVVMALASLGILVNGFTAWLLRDTGFGHQHSHAAGDHTPHNHAHSARHDHNHLPPTQDLNVRGAYLHMLADALVSLGVVLGGALVHFTGWQWLDPLLGLGVVGFVAYGGWGLLRDTVRLGLQAVPAGIDPAAVGALLRRQPGVTEVHDLHIWALNSQGDAALTAHLVRPGGADAAFLGAVAAELHAQFGIGHSTVQVEDVALNDGCAGLAAGGIPAARPLHSRP